jgi:ssDNA-binding Zn-finger/Zn-ribbon topoisomerase 1
VSTEDDYAKGHLCPSCGTDQRLRRQRFGGTTDAIEKGLRLHAALEMLELMVLLEEFRMEAEFERLKRSDPYDLRINHKFNFTKYDLDV